MEPSSWFIIGLPFVACALLAGLLFHALIGAMVLRWASWLLGAFPVRFGEAFKTILITSFIAVMLQICVGFNVGSSLAVSEMMSGNQHRPQIVLGNFGTARVRTPSPTLRIVEPVSREYAGLSVAATLLITTAIFMQRLPGKEGTRMSFIDGFALAALYTALDFAVILFVILLAFGLASLIAAFL